MNSDTEILLRLRLTYFGSSQPIFTSNLPSVSISFCDDVCYLAFRVGAQTYFNLQQGYWNVSVLNQSRSDQLQIVSKYKDLFLALI